MKNWKIVLGFVAVAVLAFAIPLISIAAINVTNHYPNGGTAGVQILPDERVLVLRESDLTHIDSSSGSDTFVNKGDAVLWGDIGVVGVALSDATASTDLVSVATRGVFHLSVLASSGADIAPGDLIRIITATGDISTTTTGSIQFGYYLGRDTLSSSSTSVAPVMISRP